MFCVHVSNCRFQPVHVNSKKVQFRIIDVFFNQIDMLDTTDQNLQHGQCSVVYKHSASLHVKRHL
jgi:hypothetical protein